MADDLPNANEKQYTASNEGKYLFTQILTHTGITIAFALGKTKDDKRFIDYSILNAEEETDTADKAKKHDDSEQLDSQHWFDNVKTLRFSSEVRVVGEEAVPVYELPLTDSQGLTVTRDDIDKIDPWKCTTMCLMDPKVNTFQVLSDGKYIYVFRQSRPGNDDFLKTFARPSNPSLPPIDRNLLCDRFMLVGSRLNKTMEVRFRRSRQKRIPLNNKDTLAVRDINECPFDEPTFSLRFVQPLDKGRFNVLQAPTMTNDVSRWMIFTCPETSFQIDCFTADVTDDGLFDIHGRIYYTCDNDHKSTFVTAPGSCTALKTDGNVCGKARKAVIPKTSSSNCALSFAKDPESKVDNGIFQLVVPKLDLSTPTFSRGYTLEAWIRPTVSSVTATGEAELKPPETQYRAIFRLFPDGGDSTGCPGLMLTPQLTLALRLIGTTEDVATSVKLKADDWNHVALRVTRGSPLQAEIIVNGESSPSGPKALPAAARPGIIETFIWQPTSGVGFPGALDEIRLWSCPLEPAVVKARMATRVSGTEPYLEACWHLDEGSGLTLFDATNNNHNMTVKMIKAPAATDEPVTFIWSERPAQMLDSVGLAKSSVRFRHDIAIAGGLSASIYYEQVSVSTPKANKDEQAAAKAESEAKPLKRGARVLLAFVAYVASKQVSTLATLDFGLLSDGTLCDAPPVISLPPVKAISRSAEGIAPSTTLRKYAPTSLLHVDPLGTEVFGGYLDFATAQCSPDAPFAWNSATGTVTIYYKSISDPTPGAFSALTYDVSRTMTVGSPVTLTTFPGIAATSKLRQAKSLTIKTLASDFDPKLTVDVEISVIISSDNREKRLTETWKNVPANLDKMCSLLSGHGQFARLDIGTLAEPISKYGYEKTITIDPEKELQDPVDAATCLSIGGWRYLVSKKADAKAKKIMVFGYLRPPSTSPQLLERKTTVTSVGYDHIGLVTTKGKPAPDYSLGSALAAITPASEAGADSSKRVVAPKLEATIVSAANAPYFGDSRPSTALQLKDNITFSMLSSRVVQTSTDPGLAFEGWIKPDRFIESVVIAYTAERTANTLGTSKAYQTFVLALRQKAGTTNKFQVVCNINGRLLCIEDDKDLEVQKWFHIACSIRNSIGLYFTGLSYVDFGSAMELNIGDFSLAFTLQITRFNGLSQIILTKSSVRADDHCPIHLEVTSDGHLRLVYNAGNEAGARDVVERHEVVSTGSAFVPGVAYKVFVSRAYTEVKREGQPPLWAQCVTMKAWDSNDGVLFSFSAPAAHKLVEGDLKRGSWAEAGGVVVSNSASLYLGGAPWATLEGTIGFVGSLRLYSAVIPTPTSYKQFCKADNSESGLIGVWSDSENNTLVDATGKNHGKFKKEPKVTGSPFAPDHHATIYLNGRPKNDATAAPAYPLIGQPAGPHQLTIGNVIQESNPGEPPETAGRFLFMSDSFDGEADEFRIWNVPRTRNNICDTMNARLSEAPPEMAVYLPFDTEDNGAPANATGALGILADHSINCWHLTPLFGETAKATISQAPVGKDAACVQHTYGNMETEHTLAGAQLLSSPTVAEYGTMQIGASGSFEGSYKRAYSFIDKNSIWRIDTGFRIGTLLTEWISQVQTSPTLVGYIEGAPPIPAENFPRKDDQPKSSIKFVNTQHVQYAYGLRSEHSVETNINLSLGGGGEWKVNAGVGVETEVSSGKIKAFGKFVTDITSSTFNNNVSTIKSHSSMDVKMDLTGVWLDENAVKQRSNTARRKLVKGYNPANTGLAVVESEVADVFALRLKIRGSVAPLVAYQMRPNPDIPKDRNLVTFLINNNYTKQGCLNGRRDNGPDVDYNSSEDAPKDASYYKPVEAYALKDRIMRAEEQLAGEYERYCFKRGQEVKDLPARTRRNICNSYVWTAEGGTYQDTHSTMDFVQQEVGGNNNVKLGGGGGYDIEIMAGGGLFTSQYDAICSVHTNVMQTKDKQSETGFELVADLPPPTNIRLDEHSDELEKRPGAVDAYRWMTFWLEGSEESTDAFFKQVVDEQWVSQSSDPSATLLRSLRTRLDNEPGNARTKAWRLFHRVTYVSRVGEQVKAANKATAEAEKKTGALLADVSCNWLILQRLEPLVRAARTNEGMKTVAVEQIEANYPTVAANPRLKAQLVELLGDYIGFDTS